MADGSRAAHWESIYTTKAESEVSWFQQSPAPSFELIVQAGATSKSVIIDIGGGASRLVDNLIGQGFEDVTVLDLSASALAAAKGRLGAHAERVSWIVADATSWARLERGLKIGGHAIIATFALDGPEKCSGLPVVRYDSASLGQMLGGTFKLIHTQRHVHATPWDAQQNFQFSMFRRER